MDVDLITFVVLLAAGLLAAIVVVAAQAWARAVESSLSAAHPASPRNTGTASDNPTVLFQPPEDAPPA
jgi:hypothetical protein